MTGEQFRDGRGRRPLRLLLTWLAILTTFGCGPSISPVPEPPNLASVDEEVREQYRNLRARLDGLDADAPAAERAAAHGDLGLWFHAYRLSEAAELAYGNALQLEPDSARWSYLGGGLCPPPARPAAAAAAP
ncbi:MAG: hypothetical protein AAGM22_00730 [Acidobacteriota bacterium]